ncbi:MAG TPA: hypothetical protein VG317_03930 [Pseudonocardiaceae bacterium]|jgi:hypothetical protein|nr:hypothetical protein [Pseudonocardiaceae bacterium]
MMTRTRICIGTIAVGAGLFVAAVVLGNVAAAQFREFVQYGYHQEGSCVTLPGQPPNSASLAWVAVALSAAGLLAAACALFVSRRPLPRLGGLVLAGSTIVAAWFGWSVVHAITTCAPYTNQ